MKANVLLDLFITYLQSSIAKLREKPGDRGEMEEYIDQLLKVFEEKVIPAHKTNYVQYVLLYLFSRGDMQIFREKFVSLLFLQAFDEKLFVGTRLRYLNYFASFLASAQRAEGGMLAAAMRMVLEKLPGSATKLRTHIVQSLLYIVCYRWKETKELPGLAQELVSTVIRGDEKSLIFVESSILSECALLLQYLDHIEYAPQIAVLDKVLAEQKSRHVRPVSAYFLFGAAGISPVVDERLKENVCLRTYRQAEGHYRKNSNTTNSCSVESIIAVEKRKSGKQETHGRRPNGIMQQE